MSGVPPRVLDVLLLEDFFRLYVATLVHVIHLSKVTVRRRHSLSNNIVVGSIYGVKVRAARDVSISLQARIVHDGAIVIRRISCVGRSDVAGAITFILADPVCCNVLPVHFQIRSLIRTVRKMNCASCIRSGLFVISAHDMPQLVNDATQLHVRTTKSQVHEALTVRARVTDVGIARIQVTHTDPQTRSAPAFHEADARVALPLSCSQGKGVSTSLVNILFEDIIDGEETISLSNFPRPSACSTIAWVAWQPATLHIALPACIFACGSDGVACFAGDKAQVCNDKAASRETE
mmetsp:Transcript_30434/g.48787  ORF Transcript_30434/g.48787 Transcript_30434/m.48787 type:complete len:292 (+) Transcript_30434:621-1496(+)